MPRIKKKKELIGNITMLRIKRGYWQMRANIMLTIAKNSSPMPERIEPKILTMENNTVLKIKTAFVPTIVSIGKKMLNAVGSIIRDTGQPILKKDVGIYVIIMPSIPERLGRVIRDVGLEKQMLKGPFLPKIGLPFVTNMGINAFAVEAKANLSQLTISFHFQRVEQIRL